MPHKAEATNRMLSQVCVLKEKQCL